MVSTFVTLGHIYTLIHQSFIQVKSKDTQAAMILSIMKRELQHHLDFPVS
jgi:hypothetical protein